MKKKKPYKNELFYEREIEFGGLRIREGNILKKKSSVKQITEAKYFIAKY